MQILRVARSDKPIRARVSLSLRVSTALALVVCTELLIGQGLTVPDGSFETPLLQPGGYAEGADANSSGIFFLERTLNFDVGPHSGVYSYSGILRPSSSAGNVPSAFGDQYAFLHSGGSFGYHFSVPTSATYQLSFSVAPDDDGYLSWGFEMNPDRNGGVGAGEETTVAVGWHERHFEFTPPAGESWFWFRSNPMRDYDLFIDNITITPIPEPSAWVLLLTGVALCIDRVRPDRRWNR